MMMRRRKIKVPTWLLFKYPTVADNDFWRPGEKVLSGTERSDAKGQIPQGEISTWLCNMRPKLEENRNSLHRAESTQDWQQGFNCCCLYIYAHNNRLLQSKSSYSSFCCSCATQCVIVHLKRHRHNFMKLNHQMTGYLGDLGNYSVALSILALAISQSLWIVGDYYARTTFDSDHRSASILGLSARL